MARKAMILKQKEEPKFSTRYYNRCKICGRPGTPICVNYGVCRICFRELAYKGEIPGVRQGFVVILFPAIRRCGGLPYTRYCLRRRALSSEKILTTNILVNLFPSCGVFDGSTYTRYAFPIKPCLTKKSSPICPQIT